jgi:hypothetical protein
MHSILLLSATVASKQNANGALFCGDYSSTSWRYFLSNSIFFKYRLVLTEHNHKSTLPVVTSEYQAVSKSSPGAK